MLIMGPICSIRSGGGAGSRQILPFLTSESDSTGRKPWNKFHAIACDIPLTFWTQWYRQHGLSLVEISRIVLWTSIMDFPSDKCHILTLECHGLSLAQVSLIVPETSIIYNQGS